MAESKDNKQYKYRQEIQQVSQGFLDRRFSGYLAEIPTNSPLTFSYDYAYPVD